MGTPAGLLLTHGAGGGADHRLLVALENQLELPVRRMEFPYRAEGRRAPDRAPKLIAAIRAEAERFVDELGCEPAALAFGGRSMGGRMCSLAIAEGLAAAAVVLLSYPLHPPGKPDRLRVDHIGELRVPTLFVNGDRDPFGTPAELESHLPSIAGPTTVHWLAGQRHDPKPACDDEIVGIVGRFLSAL
jgi:predicted alpha/beta-hydrolase family hydrolase